jgi:hypothetical protein
MYAAVRSRTYLYAAVEKGKICLGRDSNPILSVLLVHIPFAIDIELS